MLLWAFAAWTVFVWANRISNILSDGGGPLALAVAIALVGLGLAVAAHAATRRLPWAVPALAAATVAAWGVRVPLLLADDHGAAFVVVHVALAAVSVGLAVATWRWEARPAGGEGWGDGDRVASRSV